MQKSIALTGIRTFLGSNIAIRLQNIPDVKLTVIDKHKPGFLNERVNFYRIDLIDPKADMMICEALERENVDTFVHLQFFEDYVPPNPSYVHEVQTIGTWYVLNACARKKVRRFILSSTTEVYGAHPMNANILSEESPIRLNMGYSYMRDRLEAEELTQKFSKRNPGTQVFILRKCLPIGDRARGFMHWYLSGAMILTILGFDPMIQLIHQEDLIDAFMKVVTDEIEAPSGIYNIVGRGALPLSYIIRLMGKINFPVIYSFAYTLCFILRQLGIAPFPPQHIDYIRYTFVAGNEKAKEYLGFVSKYSTKESVEEFAGYAKLKKAKIKTKL